MPAATDVKQLVAISLVSLIFLAAAVLVAHLTRSAMAVGVVMAGMGAAFVAMGFMRARLQNGEQVLVLEGIHRRRRRPRSRSRSRGPSQ